MGKLPCVNTLPYESDSSETKLKEMNEMKSEAPSIISGSTFIARITN